MYNHNSHIQMDNAISPTFISATAFGWVLEFTTFHTIPNYTHQCKFDNISYINAHAWMTVIYTYFSASFTVVAQDEYTKMHFNNSIIFIVQGTINH
jgi:hypothetical protein